MTRLGYMGAALMLLTADKALIALAEENPRLPLKGA